MGELLCCRVNGRAIVPGTFQSGFPEVPWHSPSPISPPTHTFILSLRIHKQTLFPLSLSLQVFWITSVHFLLVTKRFSKLAHTVSVSFRATRLTFSSLCLFWVSRPPSHHGPNSVHYVISVGCVHTAVHCRNTMPARDGPREMVRLMNTLQHS